MSGRRGFSLLEISLVMGLLAILSVLAVPAMLRQISEERLPASARELRSLITLVRANAMLEGKLYRLRFARADEIDGTGDARQPIIERENDPFENPGVYEPVKAAWAQESTLQKGVRCMQVRPGKPVLEEDLVEQLQEEFRIRMESLGTDFEPDFPPLFFELDGSCEWATFVLTNGPSDAEKEEDLPISSVIEVIVDGDTGQMWLQRPFYDDEKAMLEENDWPPVLRQDFLNLRPLTESDVLEIQESKVRK